MSQKPESLPSTHELRARFRGGEGVSLWEVLRRRTAHATAFDALHLA